MAEQTTVDRDAIKLQPLAPPMGLLEQFNLPPKTIAFIRRNQRAIWTVIVLSVAVALGLSGYSTYREYQEAKAASALDAALIAKQDNRQLLEKVVQEYSANAAGLWAKIELARLDEKEGQRAKAISRLEEINAGLAAGTSLKPLVLSKLAGLYELEQQSDKAMGLYTELSGNEWFAAEACRAMGRLHELAGKKEEAAAMYGKYLELTGSQVGQGKADPTRDMVQSRLNQLKK
jgi:predicted negative regulator of RcsB-dependent stress response